MTIETKIMAQATESRPRGHQRQEMRYLVEQCVDLSRLIDSAIKEGLAGFLYQGLKLSGMLETLGEKEKKRLQSIYYHTVAFNLKLINDLISLLHLRHQENIQVVLLQGIALLREIYEDIGLRPTTDIDVWVLEKDFPLLVGILVDQGYRQDPLYPTTFRKGSTILDFRTHILWADRLKCRELLLSTSQESVHNNTRMVNFENTQVRFLNEYDQVLYLMLHALKHRVERLVWLADIKLLVKGWKKADWEALIQRARKLGQERPIYYALFLLIELFSFHLPVQARPLFEKVKLGYLEKKVLNQRIQGGCLPIWAPLLLLTSGKGFSKQFALFLESLFPRPEVMRQIFAAPPERRVWQLYGKRIQQCFGMIKKKGEARV